AGHEFKRSLKRPFFYVLLAGYTFITLLTFWHYYALTREQLTTLTVASFLVHPTFYIMHFLFLFLAPLLAMGTLAKEQSQHTMPLLLMSPLGHGQIVLAKLLAVLGQGIILLLPTLMIPLITRLMGWHGGIAFFAHYLALILTVAVYLMLGIMISSFTKHQLLAAFGSILLLVFFMIMAAQALNFASLPLGKLVRYITMIYHFERVSSGLLATSDLIYFASALGIPFYITVKSLDRRWW
ncbi:MAG: ABC transporter permease subunit, partial [Bacteriovoracaceae bacterium]|nr:ABC transporter permease subunit [Bacteriovoracaceae bacterium]